MNEFGTVNASRTVTVHGIFNKNVFPKKIIGVHYSSLPEYLINLADYDNIEFVSGDLSDLDFCNTLPQADIIIHAATYGQPKKFLNDQISAFKLNTSTTNALLDKLNEDGKFLFSSSCAVYTGGCNVAYAENDIGIVNTNHPRICYIEGKRAGEAICNIYRNITGKQIVSLRISFTYGPGVRPGDARAMYNFIEKGMKGDICLLDKGKAVHTYCYITDAMVIAWNALLHGTENVYNCSGKDEVSILELARIIGEIMGVKVIIPETETGVPGAQIIEKIDSSRARNEFNKTDYVSLNDGLNKTIEWYSGEIEKSKQVY